MKPLKTTELREKSDEELARQLRDLEEEFFLLRFQQATKQLERPMRLREVRKDIARVKTIIRERELAASRGGAQRRA